MAGEGGGGAPRPSPNGKASSAAGVGAASGVANPLISSTEKCKVCKEPAAKHIHYGSVTCFSCRAFFRRSIQNQGVSLARRFHLSQKNM